MRGAVQGLDDGVGVAHGAVSLLLASRSAASAFKRAASSAQTRAASPSLRSRFSRVALKSRMAASASARAVGGFIKRSPVRRQLAAFRKAAQEQTGFVQQGTASTAAILGERV